MAIPSHEFLALPLGCISGTKLIARVFFRHKKVCFSRGCICIQSAMSSSAPVTTVLPYTLIHLKPDSLIFYAIISSNDADVVGKKEKVTHMIYVMSRCCHILGEVFFWITQYNVDTHKARTLTPL